MGDPEAMLFVDHDQPQISENHILLKKPMVPTTISTFPSLIASTLPSAPEDF